VHADLGVEGSGGYVLIGIPPINFSRAGLHRVSKMGAMDARAAATAKLRFTVMTFGMG